MQIFHLIVLIQFLRCHVALINLEDFRATFVQDPDVVSTEDIIVTLIPGSTEADLDLILVTNTDFVKTETLNLQNETYYRLSLNSVINNIKADLTADDSKVITLRNDPKVATVTVMNKTPLFVRQLGSSNPEVEGIFYLVKERPRVRNNHKIQYAWEAGYLGRGVTIAVVDTHIQISHTDLEANVNVSLCYDYIDGDDDPEPATADIKHGTAVSGIIGATKGNNFCQVGVAYEAKLAAIALIGSDVSDFKMNRALSHVATADIYCGSFGPRMTSGFISTPQFAIDNLIKNGRNGKGTIYVFAAGNDGIEGNANAWSIQASIYTIIVGSVDGTVVAPYSVFGSNIFVTGFGGYHFDHLITSTQPFDECSTESLAGTSFSAPIIVGIIALALEANNELTWRDVQHLMVRSGARYRFKDTSSLKTKWVRNKRGFFYNPRAGFGLLNAQKMVELASKWNLVDEMLECDTGFKVPRKNSTNSKIQQDIAIIDRSCTVRFLENVLVLIEFQQTLFRGTVELYLISPSGTRIKFLNERPQDTRRTPGAGKTPWIFKIVSFWGERAFGRWRLQYRSINRRVEVSVTRWAVYVYGTQTKPGK